jgi:putative oxidoreductase
MSTLEEIGKWLIVGFFLVSGLANMTKARIADHIERMRAFGTPRPAAAFWLGIALQFTGCVLVATGWHAELGVAALIAFTLVATAIFHRFWQKSDPVQRNLSRLSFLANVAILGGLLLLLADVL